MDAAEPPRIVFESSAKCADGTRAGDLLRQMLAPARAPAHAWVVSMRIETTVAGDLRAEGEITNEDVEAVGHRTFTGRASDCRGLARAMGIWASLVLDGEMNRPRKTSPGNGQLTATSGRADQPLVSQGDAKEKPPVANAELPPPPVEPWPPVLEPTEKGVRHDDQVLEIGVGGFLMGGTGGLLLGAAPFVVVGVGKGFFLRPAIVVGGSLPAAQPDMMLAAGRLDGCLRLAGLYSNLRGLQFDVCAGVDAGMLQVNGQSRGYLAIGPSLELRGELGGNLALLLRGILDVQATRDVTMDVLAGRGELAMSWSLR